MQKDNTSLKVIWIIAKGFIIALLVLTVIGWLIMSLMFNEEEIVTKNLDKHHFYEEVVSGFATSSTIRELKIYKRNSILPNKVVAEINMYVYGNEKVDLSLTDRRLKLKIDHNVMMDTIIREGEKIEITSDEFSELVYKK